MREVLRKIPFMFSTVGTLKCYVDIRITINARNPYMLDLTLFLLVFTFNYELLNT